MKAVALFVAFLLTSGFWGAAIGSLYIDPPASVARDTVDFVQFVLFVAAIVSTLFMLAALAKALDMDDWF